MFNNRRNWIILLLIGFFAVAGSTVGIVMANRTPLKNATPQEVTTAYLTVLFTNDYYTLEEEAIAKMEEEVKAVPTKAGITEVNSPAFNAFLKEAQKGYSPYVTESYMKNLIANRWITSYSKLAKKAGAHIRVSSINYEPGAFDKPDEWAAITYTAHLHITYDDGPEPKDLDSRGVVNLKKIKNQWKVNAHKILNTEFDIRKGL